MTNIIGVTGGVGSGKSTLIKYLRKNNYLTHSSDEVVRNIYQNPSKSLVKHLKKIGLEKATKHNKINKGIIAKEIFTNKEIKNKLEDFVHKEVRKKREAFIKKHKKNKTNLVFIEIPLLFEKKLEHLFNKIICVLSPKKIRLNRVVRKNKKTEALFKKIIKNQTTNIERIKKSHYCLVNNKTKNNFYKKIDRVLKKILI